MLRDHRAATGAGQAINRYLAIFLQRIYTEKIPPCWKGETSNIFLPQHNLLWIEAFHEQTNHDCVSQGQPCEQGLSRSRSMPHKNLWQSTSCYNSDGEHDGCQPSKLGCFAPGSCSGKWSLVAHMHFGRVVPCSSIHIHRPQQSVLHTSEVT